MVRSPVAQFSRRSFLKGTLGAAAVLSSPWGIGKWAGANPVGATFSHKLQQAIEPDPIIKVLRWKEFVRAEKEVWLANTRRWEMLTGGRVETDFLPWLDVRPKATLEATIGKGHDIVFSFHDDPHLYPDKLLDLTELAEDLAKRYGGWYPICETYGKSSGQDRWIALPIGLQGSCMIYRKSHLQNSGVDRVPQTIEQLVHCAAQLKKKGYYLGLALGHSIGDANGWVHWWLWSFGGRSIEADGKTVAINSPETKTALEAVKELYQLMAPGVEKWHEADNNLAFLGGEISLTFNGSSIVYKARESFPQIYDDIGVANIPVGPVGYPAELSPISLGYILKHSPVPNAAIHYLSFMLEVEQYGDWIANSYGYITQSLQDYHSLPSWQQDPRITPFRDCAPRMLQNSYPGPLSIKSAAAMSDFIILDMFVDACTGERTTRQAILRAERRLARIYS